MQIQVKCSCGEEKCPEWAIVELQGVVELQPSFQGTLQNLEIGQLCRPSSQVGISSPKLAVISRNGFIFCYWSLHRMDFLSLSMVKLLFSFWHEWLIGVFLCLF